VERAAALPAPEGLGLLVRVVSSSPSGAADAIAGAARKDPRALLQAVRAIGRYADRETARKTLREVLEAPAGQLDGGAAAAGGGEERAQRVALARQEAAMALAAYGGVPAFEALVDAARKGPPSEGPAINALAAYPPAAASVLGGVALTTRSTIALAAQIGDLRALDAVLGVVKASDASLRAAAVAALGEGGDARVLDVARKALHDPDAALRVAATRALVRLGVADAGPAVEALVADDATAFEGLGLAAEVQGEGVIRAAAARAVASADRSIRQRAVATLGRQVSDAAVGALTQMARDPGLRGDVVAALARSPSPAARPALEAMAAASETARLAARGYFVRRFVRGERSQRLDALLARMAAAADGRDRAVAVEALVALGTLSLATALQDPDPRVRRAAAMGARARLDEPEGRVLLTHLVADNDGATRAVLSLGLAVADVREGLPASLLIDRARSGGPDAALAAMAIARRDDPSLASDVGALLAGPDPLVRAHAARGLGASTAPAASGLLAAAYSFEADAFVRRAVVGAAGERPKQDSTNDALELAAQVDPDPVARELARRALRGGPSAAASVPEVAWMQVVAAESAALPADLEGVVVESDGLAVPVAFDEEGFALLPGVPPGECRLRLAPSLPPYSASGQ
jgi:hypothetical protein